MKKTPSTASKKVSKIFNTDNNDCWFLSSKSPEMIIRVDGEYFLMDSDYKIIELKIKQPKKH